MQIEPTISGVSHLIQLSVAPVFLLAGIGSVLGVMTNRLSRIVDRARAVEGLLATAPEHRDCMEEEMRTLERRARMISLSIGLCTVTSLLVCAVIAIMFLSAFFSFNTSSAVAALFIAAMLIFIAALIMLLREVLLATAALRFGPRPQ